MRSIGCICRVLLWLVSWILARNNSVESRWLTIQEDLLSFQHEAEFNGTRWAVLVAGSNEYYNYRHQADVSHAYQIMKQGGLADENIIVFMYDDIAYNKENPTPGFIINKPHGPNVYHGVPKDYTGNHTNANNLYAVLLGDKKNLTGGSGKVLSSGPDDHVFFYYTDHGSTGILGMPVGESVYANDLIQVLTKKHKAGGYKKMAIYIEACESGSMLSGLLSDDMDIYATTASNPDENSWACYCPRSPMKRNVTAPPGSPEYYGACLGDTYSVAWLEDSDVHDPKEETLEEQYQKVKKRTNSSHVMQYGNKLLGKDLRSVYMGQNYPDHGSGSPTGPSRTTNSMLGGLVEQLDAKIAYLNHKVQRASNVSPHKMEWKKMLRDELLERELVDRRMQQISEILFGQEKGLSGSMSARPDGQPVVDDWDCYKTMVMTYEEHCGALSRYGRKYTRMMANMCNAGISKDKLVLASTKVCSTK
ncbi:hypothetical protein SAY87_031892 [Trapa incisa]|uniref:Legumain prodomain domain-containing protein n=1 Tax=Trapa incisa TaxID=236973 RepID=A0AAN7KQZ8_9MYRT|nr:hypothetical protein SAY87_031892 [Trapa incisa]